MMTISVLSVSLNVLAAKLNNNKNNNLPKFYYLVHILLDNVSNYDYPLLPLKQSQTDIVERPKKRLLQLRQRNLKQTDIVMVLDRMQVSLFEMVVVERKLGMR